MAGSSFGEFCLYLEFPSGFDGFCGCIQFQFIRFLLNGNLYRGLRSVGSGYGDFGGTCLSGADFASCADGAPKLKNNKTLNTTKRNVKNACQPAPMLAGTPVPRHPAATRMASCMAVRICGRRATGAPTNLLHFNSSNVVCS